MREFGKRRWKKECAEEDKRGRVKGKERRDRLEKRRY